MNSFYVDIIGYIGAFLLSIMFVPQIYQLYKLKNADAISYKSQLMSLLSSVIMLVYGILLGSVPIIVSNCSIIACVCIIMALKYKFDKKSTVLPR